MATRGGSRAQVCAQVVVLLLSIGALNAQERWGRIVGNVTDQSGGLIGQAVVSATSPSLPRGLETATDSLGNYVLANVPIGVYTITVTKTGFTTLRQTDLEVKLGSEFVFNARLPVGQVTEVVEVTSSNVQLETTSSRTSTNITQTQFENIPKGRSFTSLLAMAPGTRIESKAGAGGVQVDGASGSENAFVIDGVDVADIRSGALRGQYAVPLQFVQEVQIKSGGFEAEYGGANGGVINVATRAGSNTFHGQAELEFTGDWANPQPRAFWQSSPLNANLPDYFRPKEDGYRTLYPGGSLGGPIVKDRLFFFAAYFPTLGYTERIIPYAAPTGTRTYTSDSINHYGLGRVDYSPTQKVQVNTSWIWTPIETHGRLPSTDTRIAPPTNDLTVTGGFTPSQAYTASANYTPTGRLLLSGRYGYKYLNDKGGNYGLAGAPYITYQTASAQAPGVPEPFFGRAGFSNVTSTFGIVRDVTTRHNIYLDGSWVTTLGGQQHTIKAGYAVNRIGNDVNDDYTNGRFLIYWGEAYSRGSINAARGAYGYYFWRDGVRHNSKVNSHNQGFYIQDTWRAHARLTISAGVRFENEFLPPYKAEAGGIKVANPVAFGWGEKAAPRLGASWDILGDGRWKLAGSFGLFYDVMKYELARSSFGGDYWWDHVYRLDNPNVFSLGKTNPGALGARIISFDNRTIPINERGELDGLEPNLKPYSTREFNVTLDRQISSRLVAGLRYTRKDLLRAVEDIGVLDAEDNEVYLIGNPGFGETRNTKSVYGQKTPNGQEFLVPKATRQYDGVEFRIQGQPAKSVQVLASYTWSRLWGNFSGLANSDENGRADPNISRAFDLPYYYFDSSGSQKNVFGLLGTDRPHSFKLFATYDLKTRAGTTYFGLSQIAYSGIPFSTSVIYQSAPTYPFGRGDLGRAPVLSETDLAINHAIKLNERWTLRLEANATNLFNQAAETNRSSQINRTSAITEARLPLAQFFRGYRLSDFVNPLNRAGFPPYQSVYGLPTAYQGPRGLRFGIRVMF